MSNVMVYNVLGEVVLPVSSSAKTGFPLRSNRQLAVGNNKFVIDMSDNPAGVYHLQIITEKGLVNRKVVVE